MADRITLPAREGLQNWFESRWIKRRPKNEQWQYADTEEWNSFGAYFLSCPWCVGFWTAGAVVGITGLFVSIPLPILVWLTASGITGYLFNKESD